MKIAALLAAFGLSIPLAAAGPTGASDPRQVRAPRPPQVTTAAPDRVAEAYALFLLGHRAEEKDDEAGAIASYTRAMELDPLAADIPAELAGLYLRQNKAQEAMASAEAALKISPANREANRVLGVVYAALSETPRDDAPRPRGGNTADENVTKAIHHLELALDRAAGEADPNVRATLARLYVRNSAYEKAIPLLSDLVNQEPGWQDGPMMLAEAYAGAGRIKDAIAWLEARTQGDPRLLPALADFYERERRWADAAAAYSRVLERAPRNSLDLKSRYASALLNAGGKENIGKARDALTEIVATRTTPDTRALYLLSQAHRRLGDFAEAEATARRVIAQNRKSPWGYYALAESLEERHQYQSVVDELAPIVAEFRGKTGDASFDVGILMPHLGFAYQELGQHDKAIASFEEGRKLLPNDPAIAGYLIEANIAAKKYGAAVDVAKAALVRHPNHLRILLLEARALRHNGKADQGIALLEEAVKTHADEPLAYIGLAQMYSDTDRGAQAVNVLRDAQTKFPQDNGILFELGAVLDKQKKYVDAESAFRQVLARDPDNATALNYLGYMLAERGERLDESVGYLKKALQIEPDNGSYLDSLGWAYFKADKLYLAEENLKRAANQLKTNSVIQEHYGQVLFKLGRYDDAIAAWTRALAGDGDSIDKSDIDKKIRAAKQKLNKR
ncbi:MAG TPA: tetratricopeptide repeat protein [Vicinamibacterales bacterium]|nr:tetratricopeptide repeat protein [Vicinamibacterales bacterium]